MSASTQIHLKKTKAVPVEFVVRYKGYIRTSTFDLASCIKSFLGKQGVDGVIREGTSDMTRSALPVTI